MRRSVTRRLAVGTGLLSACVLLAACVMPAALGLPGCAKRVVPPVPQGELSTLSSTIRSK